MSTKPIIINWLAAAAICLLLSSAYLLDGPSEIEAAQDVASDLVDAQHSARDVAIFSARLLGLTEQQP